MKKLYFIFFFNFNFLFASSSQDESNLLHFMTLFVFQLGIIIFVARLFGNLFEKFSLPSILGEIFAGILIGPYCLGSISIPGFENGFFPLAESFVPSIRPELYGISIIASILLLFVAGLETDIDLLLKYFSTGLVVGIGGVVVSFILGAYITMLYFNLDFLNSEVLFLGVIATATSIGITARILSEKKAMEKPEGVTILSGAVIDDVLGIIILAVILGIIPHLSKESKHIEWIKILLISIKAVSVWLIFTLLGVLFSKKISSFLKLFKNNYVIASISLSLALIVSGLFEKSGLAMVIGAYVMGLSLSKTDISYMILESVMPLQIFFVPIFFVVMGMMVNIKLFFSYQTMTFGLLYTLFCIIAKFFGCGIPALFFKFNKLGAARIGLGMSPRGEVAMIIAGIGIAQGYVNENIFGSVIIMILLSSLIVPIGLNFLFNNEKKGTLKSVKRTEIITKKFEFSSLNFTNFLSNNIIDYFQKEGFYINLIIFENKVYQIRKDDVAFKMEHLDKSLIFETKEENSILIQTIVYEAIANLYNLVNIIKDMTKPEEIKHDIVNQANKLNVKHDKSLLRYFEEKCILCNIESEDKNEIIKLMVECLFKNSKIENKEIVLSDILKRETASSTALEKGLAFPHTRSSGCQNLAICIAISQKGIDFLSLDNKKTQIIIMIISPEEKNSPFLSILAQISTLIMKEKIISFLLKAKSSAEVYSILEKNI